VARQCVAVTKLLDRKTAGVLMCEAPTPQFVVALVEML
jgi:hypothetical protein